MFIVIPNCFIIFYCPIIMYFNRLKLLDFVLFLRLVFKPYHLQIQFLHFSTANQVLRIFYSVLNQISLEQGYNFISINPNHFIFQ